MGIESILKSGDCLLYKPASIFGSVISVKTWHPVSHVEIFHSYNSEDGPRSIASRDGKGVNIYPTRTNQLIYVLRPNRALDLAAGFRYARRMFGTPYGWWDLLNFIGLNTDSKGIVCSAFATEFYRACGWLVFPTDASNDVAPFEFLNLIGNGFDAISLN